MNHLSKYISLWICCFIMFVGSVPMAYAGCMDSVEDGVAAFFTGGASAAACELQALVSAIQNFIQTVSDLANNVASQAKGVADAAIGAIKSAGDDISNLVAGSQQDLGKALAEAKAMTSPISNSPSSKAKLIKSPGLSKATVNSKPPASVSANSVANVAMSAAPLALNQADPQRLKAALDQGVQLLGSLKSSVDQEIAGHINTAIQLAGKQAVSHLADVADIVKTTLLAPINAVLATLNDMLNHPSDLLDPIASINTMVENLNKSILDTMTHINDVITKSAIGTLESVESNVQLVQSNAQSGRNLLNAMRHAHQEKTKDALAALETQLNSISQQQHSMALSHAKIIPAFATFHFAPVKNKLHASLQKSTMPYQTIASNLNGSWAKIKTLHLAAKPKPLGAQTKQNVQNQLDQMFRGKSPAEVESVKQKLLMHARQKYGSNPKLISMFEQNLNNYVRTRFSQSAPSGNPSSPGSGQMLNPQPLPPKNVNLQSNKLNQMPVQQGVR